jgi:hypothetical protein
MARSKSLGGAPGIRDMPFEAESINSASCITHRSPHHRLNLLHPSEENQPPGTEIKENFSTQFARSDRLEST